MNAPLQGRPIRTTEETSLNVVTGQKETRTVEVRACTVCGKEFTLPVGYATEGSKYTLFCSEHLREHNQELDRKMQRVDWKSLEDDMKDGAA